MAVRSYAHVAAAAVGKQYDDLGLDWLVIERGSQSFMLASEGIMRESDYFRTIVRKEIIESRRQNKVKYF